MQLFNLPTQGFAVVLFSGDQFTLLSSDEDVGSYRFNKHVINHKFCQVCGVSPYSEGKDPQGKRSVAVNIRCIENIDLEKVPVTHFNGRDF